MTKKFFIILIIIFFGFLFFSKPSFGFTVNYDDEYFDLPSFPSDIISTTHFIITYQITNNRLALYYTNDSDFGKFQINSKKFYDIYNVSGGNATTRMWSQWEFKSSSGWTAPIYTKDWGGVSGNPVLFATDPVYNQDGSVYYNASDRNPPEILLSNSQLGNGDWDYFDIAFNDVKGSPFYLTVFDGSSIIFNIDLYHDYSDYIERMDLSDPFSNLIFRIPKQVLPEFTFISGHTYQYVLSGEYYYVINGNSSFEISRSATCTVTYSNTNGGSSGGSGNSGSSSDNKELENSIKEQTGAIQDQTNSIKEQTEAIKEQNETSKGIWGSIKEILSFLNPFSENFFVYKLIELLVEAIKSLFIPSDDFFSNWLDDLNSYFGETFGILYYPLEIVIDFLNRIGKISETTGAIISIPSFTLNFMGYSVQVLPAFSFDFNSIVSNEPFKTIHDIYLVFVDIILWLGLIYLASKMIRQVLGGMGDEVESRIDEAQEEERSYDRYKQYQENKKRYKEENKGK